MRILVVGGLGFVGGRLAKHLAQSGHVVLLGSRKAAHSPAWLPQAEMVHIEWEDDASLQRSCCGMDIVIHAAGMNAQDSVIDPVAALAFNGMATARLVAAASRAGVRRFLYLSTAHVYASPLVGVITEETCPSNLHPYATSHLAGECAALSANQRGQIQSIVLRLSNAFGVPMHPDVNCWMLLVNDLCKQAVQTRELVLQTSGLQQRDFLSILHVCRVVEYLGVNFNEPMLHRVFNVGAGVSQSVLEMAQLIQERCKEVLGYYPELRCAETVRRESHEFLMYRTERLLHAGCLFNSDNESEIDNLLRYCQSAFSEKVES